MSRNLSFHAVMVIIVVAAVELQSWVFAAWATQSGQLRFYSTDIFLRMTDAQLAHEGLYGPLGWPSNDKPRAEPSAHRPVCGSAFGDSMTYGSEVEDEEAWVHLLSLHLGCTVVNYAVPAYGFDQAVMRYERLETEGRFVILGLFNEMIRRSVAASWTFYAPSNPMAVYQIKPLFSLDGEGLRLHPMPEPLTRETIAAHHANDYYMQHVATAATFPYSRAVLHATYLRLVRTDDYRRNTEKYLDVEHPSGSGVLARRLIDRFAQIAHARNARLAIVLVPTHDRVMLDTVWEDRFVDDLRRHTGLCMIDLKPPLRERASPLGGKIPSAPQGHYTALGNRWIADAVADDLGKCGIVP